MRNHTTEAMHGLRFAVVCCGLILVRRLYPYFSWLLHWFQGNHTDGLAQGCSDSSALALELLQSCAKPSVQPWQIWVNASGEFTRTGNSRKYTNHDKTVSIYYGIYSKTLLIPEMAQIMIYGAWLHWVNNKSTYDTSCIITKLRGKNVLGFKCSRRQHNTSKVTDK